MTKFEYSIRTAIIISVTCFAMACDEKPSPSSEDDDDGPMACDDDVALAAELALEQSCYQCHGQNGTANGNMNFIMDVEQLIAHGLVIPNKPDESRIYVRMEQDTMPPLGVSVRPDAEARESVRKWIECGAPPFGEEDAPREFVSTDEVLHALKQDLEQRAPADRPYTRYLSFVNLHNDPNVSTDSLSTYRHGLNKQINDVSRGPMVTLPQSIDDREILYRIDIRDYRWEADQNGEDLWELLVHEYPYGVYYLDQPDAAYLYEHTTTLMPVINADWFVFESSDPPLYYDMLRLPGTIAEVKEYLGVAENGDVATAGLIDSGVSTSNRVVIRRNSLFGVFWESADFGTSIGDKNILENPLPVGSGFADFEHVPDGGEYIFSLPNNLHGYLISNGIGAVIEEAPKEIVFDRTDPFNPTVRSGRKCSKCHAEGINPVVDRVRDYVENIGDFPEAVIELVQAEYPTVEAFDELVAQDREEFLAARAATGIPSNVEGKDSVPISFLADAFQASVSIDHAAADFGLSVVVLRALIANSDELRESLGPLLLDGGVLKRETYSEAFHPALCALGLGQPLINGEIAPCLEASIFIKHHRCPCNPDDPSFNNFCLWPPSTAQCPMTEAGGYCDPNGDASFGDGDLARGFSEYLIQCG